MDRALDGLEWEDGSLLVAPVPPLTPRPQTLLKPSDNETHLIEALRSGDEAAFVLLIDLYHAGLVRLAIVYVSDRNVAEEVAQETWLALLEGIGRFEGRSSLKTWIFRILANRARTRAVRERRTVAFSELLLPDVSPLDDEPPIDPERFLPADDPRWPHHWASPPAGWGDTPERLLLLAKPAPYRPGDCGIARSPAGSNHPA